MRQATGVGAERRESIDLAGALQRLSLAPLARFIQSALDPEGARIHQLHEQLDTLLASSDKEEILKTARSLNRILRHDQAEVGLSEYYQTESGRFLEKVAAHIDQTIRVVSPNHRLGLVVALNGITASSAIDCQIDAILLDRSEEIRDRVERGFHSEAILMNPDFAPSVLKHLNRIGEQKLLAGSADEHFRHSLVACLVSAAALSTRGYHTLEEPLIELLLSRQSREGDRIHALRCIREQWTSSHNFIPNVFAAIGKMTARPHLGIPESLEIELTTTHCERLLGQPR